MAEVFSWLAGAEQDLALTSPFGAQWSYKELADAANRFADECIRQGLTRQHRVATFLPDAADSLIIVLALADFCTVVPLNTALTDAEIAQQISFAEIDLVFTSGATGLPRLRVMQDDACPVVWAVDPSDWTVSGAAAPPPHRAAQFAGMVLFTSGSTGHPKRVPLAMHQLCASAQVIADTLGLGRADVALHALPMFHVGAFVDLALSVWLSGGRVAVSAGKAPDDIWQGVDAQGATWLQMVPTMLARCLAEFSTEQAANIGQRVRFLRSVSADLPEDRQAQAEMFFGGLPVIQMYGMSETAGQIASNLPPPGDRVPGSVGRVIGPEVAIIDQNGTPLNVGQSGQICVKGPTVMAGYEGQDSTDHFVGDWLRTGDLGHLTAEGHLVLDGRLKEIINRGGEKISPIEIERAILTNEAVSEAAAYALPHPTLGEQVGLSIVLKPGAVASPDALLGHLRARVADYKCPREIDIRCELPRLGSGKVDKISLKDREEAAAPSVAWTGTAALVAAAWEEVLGKPPLRAEDDFFDQGGDSLSATEFVVACEARLGQPIAVNSLFDAPRFGDLVGGLSTPAVAENQTYHDPVLDHLREVTMGWRGTKTGACGLVFAHNALSARAPLFFCCQGEIEPFQACMGDAQPFYVMPSLQSYIRKGPEADAKLVAMYAADIQALYPDGPLYLMGYCEGAKLIRNVAEILERQGRHVAFLVSIDKWFAEPTNFPVLHVCSDSDKHSVRRWFERPELALPHMHPNGAEIMSIKGDHGEAMTSSKLAPVCAKISDWIETERAPAPPAQAGGLPIRQRKQAYFPEYAFLGGTYLDRRHPCEVTVRVFNKSEVTWPGGAAGGFSLRAGWYDLKGKARIRKTGFALLDHDVPPGGYWDAKLLIQFPPTRRPMRLRVFMVDQGFARFTDGQQRTHNFAEQVFWANPFTAKRKAG